MEHRYMDFTPPRGVRSVTSGIHHPISGVPHMPRPILIRVEAGIVTVAVLMVVASAWSLWAERAVNTPANENRQEQSNMTNEKVIMLIEAKIQPQRRAELLEAVRQYLPLVRAERGVEAFYVTARKDDPNTFVFYEVYRSQAPQDFHLQQDFTKKFWRR
jgi:quinol monooxygenase YgiN